MNSQPGPNGGNAPALPESVHKIIGYQIDEDDSAPIRPAPRGRAWMDNARGGFPFRCLPLVMANQYGWGNFSTPHLPAASGGTSQTHGPPGVNISGDGSLPCGVPFRHRVLNLL